MLVFTNLARNGTLMFVIGTGPGRVFAKQEALGALAMVLLKFNFEEVKGFVDSDKKPTNSFPGYARAFAGSGALVPGGDLRVRVRRRQRP